MRKRTRKPLIKRPAKKGPGRKSRLTPEFIETAVTLCSSLSTDSAVCRALKVDHGTWCDWKNWAEEGREPHRTMFEQIQEARGLQEIQLVSSIATDPDWRAKAWLVERLNPEQYSLRHSVEHSGPKGAPLAITAPAAITVVVQGPAGDNPYEPTPEKPEKPNQCPATSSPNSKPAAKPRPRR